MIEGRARDRIRWHCRRGLLELDLVLSAFLERHLDTLDAGRIEALQTLLSRPDPELFDLVMGIGDGSNELERELLARMRVEPAAGVLSLKPDPTPSQSSGRRGGISGTCG